MWKKQQFKVHSKSSCSKDNTYILSDNLVTFSFKIKNAIPLIFAFVVTTSFGGQKHFHFNSFQVSFLLFHFFSTA